MQEELIQEFKNGNKRAGDDYYNANIELVYSVANKYTKLYIGQEEVLAIVNQAFAHVMENINLEKAKFSTYFYAVAHGMLMRHCRDYAHTIRVGRKDYAKNKKTIFCESLDQVITVNDSEVITLSHFISSVDDRTGVLVEEALNKLDVKDRQAFKLHLLNGLTQEQIGKILGTGQVEIGRRIRRAKSQLRVILKEVCWLWMMPV